MNKKLKTEAVDHLFQAILTLKDVNECYTFFEDICTISEIKAIAQRLEVARMLDQNVTYHDISQKTGASTATICRVKKCLVYGNGGYRVALERLGKKEV